MITYKISADPLYKKKIQEIRDITGLDEISASKALINAQGNVSVAVERHFNGTTDVVARPAS